MRALTSLGLKEAKDLVDGAPEAGPGEGQQGGRRQGQGRPRGRRRDGHRQVAADPLVEARSPGPGDRPSRSVTTRARPPFAPSTGRAPNGSTSLTAGPASGHPRRRSAARQGRRQRPSRRRSVREVRRGLERRRERVRARDPPLDSSVPGGYAAALRCPLTARGTAARRLGASAHARTVAREPSEGSRSLGRLAQRLSPPPRPPAPSPARAASPSRRSVSPSRSRTSSPCRPTASTGCSATTPGRPASRRPSTSGHGRPRPSPVSRRSSRRSPRSRTSPGPCRCRSATTASSRRRTRSTSARSAT